MTRDPLSRMVRVLHYYSKHVVGTLSPLEIARRAAGSRRKNEVPTPHFRAAKQLRDHEIDALVARYHDLRSMRILAAEFKMSRTTIRRLLAKRGVETLRSMTAGDISRAVEMYGDGLSSAVIGGKLGFDGRTVIRELRKAGVTIRPPVA